MDALANPTINLTPANHGLSRRRGDVPRRSAENYRIKSPFSKDGDIYVLAEEVRVLSDGTLLFLLFNEGRALPVLGFAPSKWSAFYLSHSDGSPLAADPFELIEPREPWCNSGTKPRSDGTPSNKRKRSPVAPNVKANTDVGAA